MVRILLLVLALGSAGVTSAVVRASQKEPPLRLTIELDGHSIQLEEGQEVKVEGSFENPTVRVLVQPHREFNAHGVRFLYPSSYTWEQDLEVPLLDIQTISGNDALAMLQASPAIALENYLEELGSTMDIVEQTSVEFETERGAFPAERIILEAFGFSLVWHVVDLRDGRLLILQDAPDEGTDPTDDYRELESILRSSLQVEMDRPEF